MATENLKDFASEFKLTKGEDTYLFFFLFICGNGVSNGRLSVSVRPGLLDVAAIRYGTVTPWMLDCFLLILGKSL